MLDSFVADIEDLIRRRLWSLDLHERRRVEDAALDIYSQTDSIIALRHGRPVALVHERMGRAFNLGGAHHDMEATAVQMQRIPYLDDLLENRRDAPPQHRGSGHGLYDVRYAAPPDSRPHHSSRHAGGSHSYASRRNSHRESGSSRHTGGATFGWTRHRHRHRSDAGRSRHGRAWSNERFRRDAEEAARRSAEEDARERRDRDRHRYDRYDGRHAGRYDDRDNDRHGDYFSGSRSGTSGHYSPPPRQGHGYSSSSHRAHPPPRPHPQPYPQAPPANETPTQRFVRLTKTPYGFYDILGVDREASQAEIRKAYRKIAFLHHPDRNPGDEENADARFKTINEAQETLTDDLQKERYDIFGMKPLS